jgi:hypothetical protein
VPRRRIGTVLLLPARRDASFPQDRAAVLIVPG